MYVSQAFLYLLFYYGLPKRMGAYGLCFVPFGVVEEAGFKGCNFISSPCVAQCAYVRYVDVVAYAEGIIFEFYFTYGYKGIAVDDAVECTYKYAEAYFVVNVFFAPAQQAACYYLVVRALVGIVGVKLKVVVFVYSHAHATCNVPLHIEVYGIIVQEGCFGLCKVVAAYAYVIGEVAARIGTGSTAEADACAEVEVIDLRVVEVFPGRVVYIKIIALVLVVGSNF